jgi:RNA polymerase sigma-70 factor (ECF subfamily)
LLQRRYGVAIHGFAFRIVRDRQLAEDVMQETLLQVFKNLHTLKDPASLRAWVFAITTNRSLDAIKKRARMQRRIVNQELETDVADPADPPAVLAMFAGDVRELEKCLGELPPKTRVAIALRFGEDISFEDVASSLGERPDAVRMRIQRALPKLRACLEAGGVAR